MKNLIILLALCLTTATTIAQEYTRPKHEFGKGQLTLTLGVGVIPADFKADGLVKIQNPMLAVDYGITNRISLGAFYSTGEDSFQSNVFPTEGPTYVHMNQQVAGLRVLAHTNQKHFDVYGGFGVGYNFGETTVGTEEPQIADVLAEEYHQSMAYTGIIGAKYYFAKRFSINGEIQINGHSMASIGIGMRL